MLRRRGHNSVNVLMPCHQGLSSRIPLGFKILDQKSLGVHMGCSYIVNRIIQSLMFTYFATMISSLLISLFTYFRVSKLRHFVSMLPISLVIVSLVSQRRFDMTIGLSYSTRFVNFPQLSPFRPVTSLVRLGRLKI